MSVHLPDVPYRADQLAEIAEAIEILERVFPGFDVRFTQSERTEAEVAEVAKVENHNGRQQPSGRLFLDSGGTIRDRVRHATTGKFASVTEIAEESGLEIRQVRGVVNAPDAEFERQRSDGIQRYQFVAFKPRS
jgi:hypothetical protein